MTLVPALLPCPHCGNQPLPTAVITERGVERVWCAICFSSARLDVWNRRDGAGLHLATTIATTGAAITNLACLNTLDPERVAYVLQSAEFSYKRTAGLVALWEYHHGAGGAVWAYVPMDRDLADYAQAMHRVIKLLARIKGTSELHVYLEIVAPALETPSLFAPPPPAAVHALADLGITTEGP